ncbi:hypothetical protein DRN67_00990 [Candidatus Micrarchaeota archaeon]|nr:MAG: hypothetical protein DRN67_00990 [Candidatus Micrarchaeota archaeon]
MRNGIIIISLLFIGLMLFGCIGSGDPSLLSPIQRNWMAISIIAILTMYFAIALLYMGASLLGMPGLIAWCKSELFQITATAIMVFMLAFAITGVDEASKSFTSTGNTAMQEAQDYTLCQSQVMWSTYNHLIWTTAPIQILYSSQIHIRPLKMGFSVQPAKFLQPIMDNLGIAMTMLATTTWASRLLYTLLIFTDDIMLSVFLPLGVLLRAVPMTRSAGGALIAVAVAFYIALPLAVIVNSMVYEEHYGQACDPNRVVAIERVISIGGGWKHYVWDAMLKGTQGIPASVFGKMHMVGFGMLALVFGGFSLGAAAPWLISGAVAGMSIAFFLAWAKEIIFMVVILGFVGLVIDYMITFTFARELGRILGADVNLSALMKIL